MKFSLIVTSQNRTEHLKRLLEGVDRNTIRPEEILLVSNDVKSSELNYDLNINIYPSPFENFPIGKNRNYGASKATTDYLFFLDVDCIPADEYFEILSEQLEAQTGLWMGQPQYLSKKVKEDFDYIDLENDAIYHPYRPLIQNSKKEIDYAIFWSLCFAIRKKQFLAIGGFDENYIGYGAEDTDFAFMVEELELPFYLSSATVYHQQHTVYRPPVNHLEEIVINSNTFKNKWGKWPMGGWLKEFADEGWIQWTDSDLQDIQVIKRPSKEEMKKFEFPEARFV